MSYSTLKYNPFAPSRLASIVRIDTIDLITKVINPSTTVSTTKLDITLKGVINYLREDYTSTSREIVDYLNMLRIVYYLARVKYYNKEEFKKLNSKYTTFYPYFKDLILIGIFRAYL